MTQDLQDRRFRFGASAAELQLLDPDRRLHADRLSRVNGQATPQDVANLVWEVALTECTRPGGSTPSYFLSHHAESGAQDLWTLFEQSGSVMISKPEPLSEADRRNAVTWRGRTLLKVSTLRKFNFGENSFLGSWSDWADTTHTDNLLLVLGTTEAFALEKRNNQWFVDGKTPGEFAALHGRDKLSCATATAPQPFAALNGNPGDRVYDPFTDEREVAKGTAEEKASAAVDTNASALRAGAYRAANVNVTADEFDARLAAALKDRARGLGIDPSQYGAAMKMVGDIVRLCSSVSEPDFAGSLDQFGNPHLLNYKGGAYKDCVPTGASILRGVPDPQQKAGLFVRHDLRKTWSGKGWGDIKLHVDVFLKPASENAPPSSLTELEGKYILLAADVKNVGHTADAKFVCRGTRVERTFSEGAKSVYIDAPTKIARLKPSAAASANAFVELEGMQGSFQVRKDQIRESCSQ